MLRVRQSIHLQAEIRAFLFLRQIVCKKPNIDIRQDRFQIILTVVIQMALVRTEAILRNAQVLQSKAAFAVLQEPMVLTSQQNMVHTKVIVCLFTQQIASAGRLIQITLMEHLSMA